MHAKVLLALSWRRRWRGGAAPGPAANAAAWEPTKPVTFIIPAGTGGGADQMARFIQGVVTKHNLMKQPIIVVNKAGGAGAEGFLDVKDSKGDPHKIIITLSNLFTTPLATGAPFNWKDMTPVAMLALDQFVLWVNAASPYKTAKEYVDAVKAGDDSSSRWAAPAPSRKTRSSRSLWRRMTAPRSSPMSRIKGGGEVATQLVGKHVDSTREQPDRGGFAVAGRQSSPALHLRRQAQHLHGQGDGGHGLVRHPDLQGERASTPNIRCCAASSRSPARRRSRWLSMSSCSRSSLETPDWQNFMYEGAFNQTSMTGDEFKSWLEKAEKRHQDLMKEAGFLAAAN